MSSQANTKPVFVKIAFLCSAGALLGLPVLAQEPLWTPKATERCLAEDDIYTQDVDCIGASAKACMEQPEGFTTIGMGHCLSEEGAYWDGRLNEAYGPLMVLEKAADAEMKDIGATLPSNAEALRDMQRAWIAFRDAACEYEYRQWGGGSGGGPAYAGCVMRLTGQQALSLEARLYEKQDR